MGAAECVARSGQSIQPVTIPAPPSQGRPTEVPSARPTSMPDFDPAVLGGDDLHRVRTIPSIPVDLAVPVRVPGAVVEGFGEATAFVLLHVDGSSTITQIAEQTGLILPEVLGHVLELVSAGVVDMSGSLMEQDAPILSESGIVLRQAFLG